MGMDSIRRRIGAWRWRGHSHPGEFPIDWYALENNRVALVNLLTAQFPACDYLEIGCDRNQLFHAVNAPNKTGIDPVRGGNVRATSDEFFRNNNKRFDVVFIDGLHTYEQVHRDIVYSLACLKPGGWIAMHDLLPRNWREEHVPRISRKWTGDVWKVAIELAAAQDVEFRIVNIDHGVGLFRASGPAPAVPDLSAQLNKERFAYFFEQRPKLPVIELAAAREWVLGITAAR